MPANSSRRNGFCGLLAILCVTLAACGGSPGATSPAPAPTIATPTPTPAQTSTKTTAACDTTGPTFANITPGNLVGVSTITTPLVGGCSYSNNFATVAGGATAGTYAGSISLTAPAGLPALANGPPGFATSNFVPLFYVTLQLTGYQGTVSADNPSINVTVKSIALNASSSNFFIGSWSTTTAGTSPPPVSATNFIGWSNNDNLTNPLDQALTVTPPNSLSLPTYLCTPASSCTGTTDAVPTSYTLVQVVGYFT